MLRQILNREDEQINWENHGLGHLHG